jgi:hypothetical protein
VKSATASVCETRDIIERFLESSLQPVLLEPGEETLAISTGNFVLESRGGCLSLQAWDERRNLVRRVRGIERQARGKLILRIERFGKRAGTLELRDLRRSDGENVTLRGARLEFRECFRRFLRRQFPTHKIAELSTEADLEHSLSPAYPRALLRQGSSAWAAIGAPPDGLHTDGALTFGLIWLDYLRRREPDLAIRGLILHLPAGQEKTTCLRLLFLNPEIAQYDAFVYGEDGFEARVDLRDYGNVDTRMEPCQRRLRCQLDDVLQPVLETPGVQAVERSDGGLSLRVHGLEFARTANGELLFGLEKRRAARPSQWAEVLRLAQELAGMRSGGAANRLNPLYLKNPEAWLESQVRNRIEAIDAGLRTAPIYGQVPAVAAANRGVLDLVAVDTRGRLAVIEIKASEDLHLPLQALDYWLRVKWHLERGEFGSNGYFPGIELIREPPRLLLVVPALDFHPTNERVLRFFSPAIPVERVGVGLEWRKELKVMFRS